MKKRINKIISAILGFVLIFLSVGITSGAEGQVYSWYCKRQSNHLRPSCPGEMTFISKYDCVWIDSARTDTEEDKVVYLTFDAGYENGNVEKILDVLKENNVTGAFFILSNLIRRNPELVRRMADEGHTVCNHTSSHRDMSKVTDRNEFAGELSKLEIEYYECTGREIGKYYRPPEGKFTEQNLSDAQSLGYKTVFWSLAYADWDNNRQMNPADAKKKILDNIHNGAIILLHPTSATNAAIMGDVIAVLKKEGYRFGSLDELKINTEP